MSNPKNWADEESSDEGSVVSDTEEKAALPPNDTGRYEGNRDGPNSLDRGRGNLNPNDRDTNPRNNAPRNDYPQNNNRGRGDQRDDRGGRGQFSGRDGREGGDFDRRSNDNFRGDARGDSRGGVRGDTRGDSRGDVRGDRRPPYNNNREGPPEPPAARPEPPQRPKLNLQARCILYTHALITYIHSYTHTLINYMLGQSQ